jgi:hypothetical protein
MQAMINFSAIEASPVASQPFDYFAAGQVLHEGALEAIRSDFPVIDSPGIFPLSALSYGPAFAELIKEVRSAQMREVISQKFGIDVTNMPLMVTVRGHAQKKDGRIHCDSKDKVVTCLLYLNEQWDAAGGRLRMLRDGENIENYAAEIPASGGSFAAFRVTPTSWHGHKPFVGERRYIMFNWIRSDEARRSHEWRHRLSSLLKPFIPFFYKKAARKDV